MKRSFVLIGFLIFFGSVFAQDWAQVVERSFKGSVRANTVLAARNQIYDDAIETVSKELIASLIGERIENPTAYVKVSPWSGVPSRLGLSPSDHHPGCLSR